MPRSCSARDQLVEVVERAEHRVDGLVVADVVAVVVLRGGVDRREPDHVDAELDEVVEALEDARAGRRCRRRRSPRTSAGRPGRRRRGSTTARPASSRSCGGSSRGAGVGSSSCSTWSRSMRSTASWIATAAAPRAHAEKPESSTWSSTGSARGSRSAATAARTRSSASGEQPDALAGEHDRGLQGQVRGERDEAAEASAAASSTTVVAAGSPARRERAAPRRSRRGAAAPPTPGRAIDPDVSIASAQPR